MPDTERWGGLKDWNILWYLINIASGIINLQKQFYASKKQSSLEHQGWHMCTDTIRTNRDMSLNDTAPLAGSQMSSRCRPSSQESPELQQPWNEISNGDDTLCTESEKVPAFSLAELQTYCSHCRYECNFRSDLVTGILSFLKGPIKSPLHISRRIITL